MATTLRTVYVPEGCFPTLAMHRLTDLLLVLLLGFSVSAWLTTPEPGVLGSAAEWFMLPGLTVGLVVMMRVLGAQLRRRPRLLNLPDKARFEALTPERQQAVLAHAQDLMTWLGLELVIIMSLVQVGVYQGGGFNVFIIAALAFAMVVSPVVAFTYIARMQSEVQRQAKAQERERTAPGPVS